MKFFMPCRARQSRLISMRGRFSRRMQAFDTSAVNGRRRFAMPPTGIITLNSSVS